MAAGAGVVTRVPTPNQVRDALGDHGVPVRLYQGWDTVGRAWDDQGGGLDATVTHHTATRSATGSSGAPSLGWCATAFSRPAANMLVGRGREDVWLLSAGSCFHPGKGGPFTDLGLGVGNVLHYRAFGIELDDPGVDIGSLTDWQIECNGRILAALQDLTGMPNDRHITHTCWTNGCHGVNESGSESPYYGRKDDTLGDSGGLTGLYSATFWRAEAKKYLSVGPAPTPTDPTKSKEHDMHLFLNGRSKWALLTGDRFARIPTAVGVQMKSDGVPWSPISEADMATMIDTFGSEDAPVVE